MLTVLAGSYAGRSVLKAKALQGFERAELIEHGTPQQLLELASSSSLFGEPKAYTLADALEDESFLDVFEALADSPHLFLIEADKLLVKTEGALKKSGANILKAAEEKTPERLNTFALADALGTRDKKRAWSLLVAFLRDGAKAEELAGILHWQARSMLAAQRAGSAAEANMKEFSFSKSKRYAKNFSERELSELSRKIVSLYHESHRGGGQLELLLERLVLSL